MVKENWYELEYEKSGNNDDRSIPVLYTSRSGLIELIQELERVEKINSSGRYSLDIPNMDYIYSVPFTHIEITDQPIANETSEEYSCKPLFWIVGLVVATLLLAGYGLTRLVMDVI